MKLYAQEAPPEAPEIPEEDLEEVPEEDEGEGTTEGEE